MTRRAALVTALQRRISGLRQAGRRDVLDHPRIRALIRRLRAAPPSIGFPAAADGDFLAFAPLLGKLLNNVGDPMSGSLYPGHSKDFEREAVAYLAELFRARQPYAGYITSGGTEGTLHALHVARTRLPDAVVFRSQAAHYSVEKATRLLAMDGVVVGADAGGQMDYEDLARCAARHRDRPAIVVANVGTTMTEAVDDVGRVHAALDAAGVPARHVHADAALAGVPLAVFDGPRPAFDFTDGADSISISGHKFLGVPMPCGAVLTTCHRADRAPMIAYTAAPDSTLTGSRNGLAAVMIWTVLHHYGRRGLHQRAQQSRNLAEDTARRLRELGWPAWRHPLAMTVVLPQLPDAVAERWPLPTEDGWSHLICMPGVRPSTIDAFLGDLQAALSASTAHARHRTRGRRGNASPTATPGTATAVPTARIP